MILVLKLYNFHDLDIRSILIYFEFDLQKEKQRIETEEKTVADKARREEARRKRQE